MSDSGQVAYPSDLYSRYIRSWKCQVSVGELYRWILAKLSDKDIKRALHKYRDLMPRQSDWNRKLTQATSVPELGFRYLYRCGQIDESNHRTMQKMLKYIDRQDLLPYFDTILYNSNYANCSLEELQKELSTMLTDAEVHADSPYEIRQCQPIDLSRITRASLKRRAKSGDIPDFQRPTVAKRIRYISGPSANTGQSLPPTITRSAAHACERVRSSLIANALSGPVVHTVLSTSLINIFAALCTTMPQVLESRNQRTPSAAGDLIHSLSSVANLLGFQSRSNPMLLPSLPLQLHQPRQQAFANRIDQPGMQPLGRQNQLPGEMAPRGPADQPDNHHRHPPYMENRHLGMDQPPPAHNQQRHQPPDRVIPLGGLLAGNRQGAMPGFNALPQPPPAHAQEGHPPIGMPNQHAQPPPPQLPPVHLKQIVLSAGGIGITESPKESLVQYYCSLKMRVNIDIGPSPGLQRPFVLNEQELLEQQINRFIQASAVLRPRSCNELICHLRFNRLYHLETFWRDYQSGFLRKVLLDMLRCPSSRSFFGRSSSPRYGPTSTVDQRQPPPPPPEQQHQQAAPPEPQQPAAAALDAAATFQWPFLSSERWGSGVVGAACEPEAVDAPGFELPSLASLAEAWATLRQENGQSSSSRFELNLFVSRRDYENGRCLLMRNLRAIPSLNCLMATSDFLSTGPQSSTGSSSATGDQMSPQQVTP